MTTFPFVVFSCTISAYESLPDLRSPEMDAVVGIGDRALNDKGLEPHLIGGGCNCECDVTDDEGAADCK
jgi:hypothetical protein